MRLAEIVETSARVAATRGRKAKTELLAELFTRAPADERARVLAWLSGRLGRAPLGVGPATVRAASRAEPAGESSLELAEVARTLDAVADESGAGSKRRREERLARLFARADAAEAAFLAKLLGGELRQGALDGLLLDAVARAAAVDPARLRRAAMLAGDPIVAARAALEEGEAGLAAFRLRLLRPLQPMLAASAETPSAALEQLGACFVDRKLDGARIQVHRAGDRVAVFSRQGNDVTDAVPEVVELALALPARELVLDGEVLALGEDGRPRAFQTTMRRFGRRLDVKAVRAELPLTPFAFDLLYVDGEELLERPAEDRFARLASIVPPGSIVTRRRCEDVGEAERFLAESLAAGHEGILAKAIDSPYEAGRRGTRWLKVKPVHSLDLVVLAAEWGSGRRRGTLSNLHLGAREPATGGFVMLGKTFKGLTDELLAWQTQELLARELAREEHVVHVKPELVVEIAFDGVQRSSQYPGGVALRFARVRGYRRDKGPQDADTLETVRSFLPSGEG